MSLGTLGSPLKAAVVADDNDSVLRTFGHLEPPHPEGPVGSIAISWMIEVPDAHCLASRWGIAWYDLTKSEWGWVYQKSAPCLASLLFHLTPVSSSGHSQEYSLKKITSRKILLSGCVVWRTRHKTCGHLTYRVISLAYISNCLGSILKYLGPV